MLFRLLSCLQIEIEPNRQIDLKVETKTGDVLVLL